MKILEWNPLFEENGSENKNFPFPWILPFFYWVVYSVGFSLHFISLETFLARDSHEVWPKMVYHGAKGKAIAPRGSHVVYAHSRVTFCNSLAPQFQAFGPTSFPHFAVSLPVFCYHLKHLQSRTRNEFLICNAYKHSFGRIKRKNMKILQLIIWPIAKNLLHFSCNFELTAYNILQRNFIIKI